MFSVAVLPHTTFAHAENAYEVRYAQIKKPAQIYAKSGEEYCPIATLPATYFVALLEESDGQYSKVSYLDIDGYMKITDLDEVDYEPVYKYAQSFFTAENEGFGAILRKEPNHDADTLTIIPDGAKILFYGTQEGSARHDGASRTWYYVKYGSDESAVFGYVYAYHGFADAVPDNIIEKVPKEEPQEPTDNPQDDGPTETGERTRLSPTYEAIFIACLCLPVVIIMFILFRRPPQERKKKSPRP